MAEPVKMCYSRDQGPRPRPRVTFTAPGHLIPKATFSAAIVQDEDSPGWEHIVCLLKSGDDVRAQCKSKPFKKGCHTIKRIKCKPPDCIVKFKTQDVQNLMACFPLD